MPSFCAGCSIFLLINSSITCSFLTIFLIPFGVKLFYSFVIFGVVIPPGKRKSKKLVLIPEFECLYKKCVVQECYINLHIINTSLNRASALSPSWSATGNKRNEHNKNRINLFLKSLIYG